MAGVESPHLRRPRAVGMTTEWLQNGYSLPTQFCRSSAAFWLTRGLPRPKTTA